MTKRQRRHHQHLREMAAIRRGKYRRRGIFYRLKPKRSLMGHSYYEGSYGNGYDSPREAWGECTCGTTLWLAVQPYDEEHYQTWGQHLAAVKRTRRPLLQNGRKP